MSILSNIKHSLSNVFVPYTSGTGKSYFSQANSYKNYHRMQKINNILGIKSVIIYDNYNRINNTKVTDYYKDGKLVRKVFLIPV